MTCFGCYDRLLGLAIAYATCLCPPVGHAGQEPIDSGLELYREHCATCHGPDGGGYLGPAIIGPDAALQSYGNAQRLLHYISTAMPQNSPGSLSEKTYLGLLAFLLIKNGIVPQEWKPDTDELNAISLDK